jgi:hypothetical protein
MKKLLTCLLTIGSIALLILSSCKKNDTMIVNSGSKSSALTANLVTLVLDKTKLKDTSAVISFNFTAPSYTYKAVVNNVLQIDADGDNWKSPTSAALGKSGSHGYNTSDFNTLLLKLNLPADKASKVNVRVANELSNVVASYSNVVTLTVTPFNLVSFIYVVGQFNGYSTAAPDSLVSLTSNGIYEGVINFPAGNNRFLVLPAKSFDNKYATTASPELTTDSITYSTEFVTGGGSDLYAPTDAGYYHITLNTNTNVITVARTNSYSAIGDATPPLGNGYTVDNDMKYVNGNQDWELTVGMVQAGGFKIRQNHDWGWSWGTLATPDGATLTDNKGGNIPITAAGTYKVTFTYPVAPYSVANTPPSVTAGYSVTKQ